MPHIHRKPHARSAMLSGFPALAESLGFSVESALTAVGIDAKELADPDTLIPIAKVTQLLDDAARLSGRGDVGLLLSQSIRLERLGLAGLLACGRPTVAAAVQAITGFSQLHNEALHLWVEPAGAQLILREEYLTHMPMPTDQLAKLSAGVIVGNLRTLIADDWKPVRVSFRHAEPMDTTTYKKIFACPISFNADIDGVTVDAADFARPNRLRDASPADYLQQVRRLTADDPSAIIVRLCTHMIWSLLPTGECTATKAAQRMGYDRRTLYRHLDQHGQTFSGLVNTIRCELATRHVGLGNRRLADIAQLLGFRSQSDFSHWFRKEFGLSATKWRRK
jgi:AraC-like DNA-binding protein